ncbi:conserved hypothetical protein [Roseibium sp. TrichSKD4]|uniref:DUF2730 family protein n=1 Tax=Roseibium sp. TrichSKD4 TaxID=744980 RepID=UPI0001E5760D|nr:DUF2730 family protein [Roseibium sp. TrichSKD4]EFO30948.1 conserved hypothetical protein [Roseibium sp. TrichSKD4]
MDMDTLKGWIAITASVFALGTAIWNHLTHRSRDNSKKVEDLSNRVQIIETEFRHMPDADAVHKLELSLAKMSGELSTVLEQIKSIQRTNKRIEDYLMEKSK